MVVCVAALVALLQALPPTCTLRGLAGNTRQVAFKGCPLQNIHRAFQADVIGLDMAIDFSMQVSSGTFVT